jgi:hypothetical protein
MPWAAEIYLNRLVERYRAERKKSTDRPSGSSPYKSNWSFYNEMRFLDTANSDSFMYVF